ncbi:MAG TPA: thiolase family protein [Acidimicrobiales bacterium]|nr:thiolase family protein [Acidimicrobiales bacterium]
MSNEAVIVGAARTPIGTAYKGSLVDVDGFTLGGHVVVEAIKRSGVDPGIVDDVVLAESLYGGGVIARYAAVAAGLTHVPGAALNRHCASGLSAVQTAAASIMAGMDDVVVAGGVQSTSTAPRTPRRVPGTDEVDQRWMSPSHPGTPEAPNMDMTITVGWNTATSVGITREDMDAWAARSHNRAIAAIDDGRFEAQIAPVELEARDGTRSVFAVDEHPRRDSTPEKLATLAPLHPEIPGFGITAGNSSGLNDGAAALVIANRAVCERQALTPLAIIRSWASVAVEPADTGLAPAPAIERALRRAGVTVDDVSLWEINEAFASVPIAAVRALGLDEERVNTVGSGCSLGHPIAMTGTRMVISLMHELQQSGGGIAVAAMCAGGGMGSAIVVEVVP